jgi:radical SAM protein with 4Fe4S-binding SPASM domain
VTSYGGLDTDLSLSAWTKILDELQRSKLLKLTLTGGEPLARPDFIDFLREVYNRPFRFSINTNGTLVSSSVIEAIRKYSSRFNEFMVSLDGPDRDTVDNQRGTGVFDKLIAGVEKLFRAGIPFGFYCTTTNLNIDRVVETAELAVSLGAQWIKFNSFLLAGPDLSSELVPAQAEVNKAAGKLSFLARKYPGRIQGTLLDMRARVLRYKKGELYRKRNRAYTCGGGTGRIAVFPDGRVTPCDHLPNLTLGYITRQSLEDILTGREMREFTGFMNRKRSDYPECSHCEYLEFCTGGCPVEPLSMNQKIGMDRHSCLKLVLEEK